MIPMNYYRPLCHLSTPNQSHIVLQARLASSTASRLSSKAQQYPYPTNTRPTPYQIFHLSPGASQKDIKTRYYDLVRYHHPDSVHCHSLTPSERHARFQAITAAYDILRGKPSRSTFNDPYREEVMRRKQFYQAHYSRRAQYVHSDKATWSASADDRWKDRLIILIGIVTLAAGLAPGLIMFPSQLEKRHREAAWNLRLARREARELGEERRDVLRKRLHDMKVKPTEDEQDLRDVK